MIFDEIREHLPHHQEHSMTAPNPASLSSLAQAASTLASAASNRLVVELAEHQLGELLTGGEINLLCTVIDTLERPRRQEPRPASAAAPVTGSNDSHVVPDTPEPENPSASLSGPQQPATA
jgi:hypothetical protein